MYFLSLFVGATPHMLPQLYGVVVVAVTSSALARFVLVPETPAAVLGRLRDAFRARPARLVSAQLDLLDAGSEKIDKALADVRAGTARLHETALMIQGRLEEGTADESVARLVQRRVADAEIAAERLGLLLTARSAERVLRPAAAGGAGVAYVRNRLLGYRDGENLPKAPPAVQDVFRGVGEAARAVLGPRVALDGPQDEPDDSPSTARSREELDAEDAAIDAGEEPSGREPEGCAGLPPGPPCRWRWGRRWRSSAGSSSPASAGTGRC